MRWMWGPPSSVAQSLTSILTSKSLALSAATDCSAVGDLNETFGSFFGVSEGVAGPIAISGSVDFSAGAASATGGGGAGAGAGAAALGGGGAGGGTGGGSEPPQATPRMSESGRKAR